MEFIKTSHRKIGNLIIEYIYNLAVEWFVEYDNMEKEFVPFNSSDKSPVFHINEFIKRNIKSKYVKGLCHFFDENNQSEFIKTTIVALATMIQSEKTKSIIPSNCFIFKRKHDFYIDNENEVFFKWQIADNTRKVFNYEFAEKYENLRQGIKDRALLLKELHSMLFNREGNYIQPKFFLNFLCEDYLKRMYRLQEFDMLLPVTKETKDMCDAYEIIFDFIEKLEWHPNEHINPNYIRKNEENKILPSSPTYIEGCREILLHSRFDPLIRNIVYSLNISKQYPLQTQKNKIAAINKLSHKILENYYYHKNNPEIFENNKKNCLILFENNQKTEKTTNTSKKK